MLTPEEKAAGKVEWKDIPPGSYIDMGGFAEDRLPTAVDQIPKTLYASACVAFLIGCVMATQIKNFRWFLYLTFVGWGAAVGFWIAARMVQSAIFIQSDIDREKNGLKKSVRPASAWKKWLKRKKSPPAGER